MKLPIGQLTAVGRDEMRNGLMLLLALLLMEGRQKLASKPASLDEITKVIDALRAAGCTGLKELDVETDAPNTVASPMAPFLPHSAPCRQVARWLGRSLSSALSI
jgi:hypothetical protein